MRKVCSYCGLEKALDEFYKDNVKTGYKYGRSAWCKECHRENRRLRYRQKKASA